MGGSSEYRFRIVLILRSTLLIRAFQYGDRARREIQVVGGETGHLQRPSVVVCDVVFWYTCGALLVWTFCEWPDLSWYERIRMDT